MDDEIKLLFILASESGIYLSLQNPPALDFGAHSRALA